MTYPTEDFIKALQKRDTFRLDELLKCAPEVYQECFPLPRFYTPMHYMCMRAGCDKTVIPVVKCFVHHPFVVDLLDTRDMRGRLPERGS